MIEALIELIPMRRYVGIMHRFAGVDLRSDRIQDETTILIFRQLRSRRQAGQRTSGLRCHPATPSFYRTHQKEDWK